MDVNLTGQVAASLIQNPWMIVSASAIGGLVAGGLTLLGVWITQKHEAERDEENRKEEAQRALIERRIQAYTNFISSTSHLSSQYHLGKIEENYFKDWYKFIAEVKLLGSPQVIRAVAVPISNEDWKDSSKVISYCTKLIPLMAEELQGYDVYKEIEPYNDQEKPS